MTQNPYRPGDRLRVTADQPYGSELTTGDLVTVTHSGVVVEAGQSLPVVYVATSYGRQVLGIDVVEPWSPPTYTPAEPDDVTDAQLRSMAAADPELGTWATDADTALGAADPQVSGQLTGEQTDTIIQSRREVGPPLRFTDYYGDELEITYVEQDCPAHGREGLFYVEINECESVLIPVSAIDPVIRYLFTRSRRTRGKK